MPISKHSPYRELATMEHALDKYWQSMPELSDSAAMDMYEEDGKLKVEISLPNFKKEDLNVTLNDNELEIAARHQESTEKQSQRHYFFRESSNRYERHVSLPEGVASAAARAAYDQGILTITMPISEPKPTRKVAIA